MRIPIGLLGAFLSLPWFVAFGLFARAFPPREQFRAECLGLVFGVCFFSAVGSLITPAWQRNGVVALAVVSALYTVAVVAHLIGRRRRTVRRSRAAHERPPARR